MDTEALEAFIEERARTEGVPGLSVAVVKGDRVVWEQGFGFADLATSTPATPSTSYLWFSMTKIVTATAVLRLAEGGNLDLDAPADEYFRGFKVVSQPVPVTVRHLLNHSSGLANPLPIRWVRPADSPVSTSVPLLIACWQAPQAEVRPRRTGQLLQPRLPGAGRGCLRGLGHELRGIRARGDPDSPWDEPHRLLLPRWS